jgi:hypothetical protein
MALYRAFSVGRFKCSGTSPKISIGDYLSEGYVLKVTKTSANKFCLNCIREFCVSKGLGFTEDADYLTIHSAREKVSI